MSITERLDAKTAGISGDPSVGDGPWTVHGVAQAAEVTRGMSDERRFWPPDVLATAADQLVGTDIVDPDDHEITDDMAQPHPDIIVGEVTDAAFDEERAALVWEGEIDDPDRATQIARGRLEVSPSLALEPGEYDAERDAERVAGILGYRDLALVSEGAHDSASVDLGAAAALARQFDVDAETLADVSDLSDGTLVAWGSSGERDAYGEVQSVRAEGDAPLDDEIDGDLTITPPAALIEVHTPDDDGWEASGTMVGHKPATLSVIDSLPDPDALAATSDDGPHAPAADAATAPSTTDPQHRDPDTDGRGPTHHMTDDDLTDHERELLAAARQKDDPEVVAADRLERLTAHESLLDEIEALDRPLVVDEDEHETLADRVDTVESLMADALAEQTALSESTIDAMEFETLATEFETDDGDIDLDALTQRPETGGADPATDDDSGMDADDEARIEAIDEKLQRVGSVLPDTRVEALRDEAADLAGTESAEAAFEVI